MNTPHKILNVSCYKFVALPDAAALRDPLQARAVAAGLRGTILLAGEGINFFLAGPADTVRGFVGALRADARFADLDPKESWSADVPFRRMQVKLKREIIRMDHPTIRPAQGRAPALDCATLRRWLSRGRDDAGREVVTLDTRNAFEVDHGSFDNAIDWRITKFSEFPSALRAHRHTLRDKTVVSFCTGGIRCEKAAILMREEGLDPVYQLEGGILKYFELTDGAHYHGGCFVFDERVLLATDLSAASAENPM
ncbi:sulfurtransferase [Verminephrobacter aporrectodeae subsp. tuberculatae]|uniref:sulfurtransferase n=2 Tax=Verminephrobacter aporrectodeae TaxID=1110389 RepID=UPI002237BD36|nr:sulfurtransferase [Verminephrobacter aporrectodeae]MCW5221635.1 sulfurtransferase [Verminephrobacter aporrectodeae subsp. tuberculatae]MCW5257948.1 sulfurtransferase [Verminephrobacter aporrectodeae subsp. tuberculatae]MCW5290925.1 sulfurtransferase [Verminephrobacter aporrectodeae subsp. tuberculatae]